MTAERIAYERARALSAGDDYDPYATDFTKSEVKELIDDTVMTEEERTLAMMFFSSQMKPSDVVNSGVVNLSLRQAYRKREELHRRVQNTCRMKFQH